MSLREQLSLKDGKARPPAVLRKICVHNGTPELEYRNRGDMALDLDFVLGRQEEIYTCIQCGHTISAAKMFILYQRYMLDGTPIVTGHRIK